MMEPIPAMDLAAVVAAQQDQIDDLTAVVEAQQRTLEELVAARPRAEHTPGEGNGAGDGPGRP